MPKPKLLILASGSKTGGGLGFEVLVNKARENKLQAAIVGVVSNHANGGVKERADRLSIPFIHMAKPFSADAYQRIINQCQADFIALSGWLKLVKGLPPAKTFNIHPGPLPRFGGKGMYGHHVHEAVMAAYHDNSINSSAVTMHFVDEQFDHGQVFFHYPVTIYPNDTPDTLASRVNTMEHAWQWYITNLVVTSQIRLENGRVIVPDGYQFLPKTKFFITNIQASF